MNVAHLRSQFLVPRAISVDRLSGGRDDEIGLQDEAEPIGAQGEKCKDRVLAAVFFQAEGKRNLHIRQLSANNV